MMMLVFIYLFLAIVTICFFVYKYFKSKNSIDLKSKHVFITGGTKGIGYWLAVLAIENGANVSIIARDSEQLDKTKMDLLKKCSSELKQKVLTFSLDVTSDYYDIEKIVTEAETVSGPINVLICCAGTAVSHRFEETPIHEFKRMVDINYLGSVNVIRACLPSMKTTGGGNIILFSSVAGLFGLYGYSAYSPSKFAIVGLAQVLAMEV